MIPAVSTVQLNQMSEEAVGMVGRLEAELMAGPQPSISTEHLIHAGMYSRTVRIPAGVVITGALIKLATVLILSGRAAVFTGDSVQELSGYHVIPGSAGRKQAFLAHEETVLTMIFPSNAATIEEAENEFTEQAGSLLSRRFESNETILITGD